MAKRFIQRRASKCARRLLAVLAVACLAAPLIPAAQQKAPLVFMTLTRRDLGDVYQGEEIEQVFPVRNDGDAPLEMDNKRLTGQAAPPSRLERAGAFRAGRSASYGLMPAAVRRAAPS
ncbi:MAG TPA: hypothetical protein VJZ91_14890 [Blastocatellia bacterium]|nr:hypothetical protein [Blastocatellia bacterium]